MIGWLRITIDLFIGRVGNRPNEFKDNYQKPSKRRSAMARRIPIVSRDELSAEHQAAYDEVAGIRGRAPVGGPSSVLKDRPRSHTRERITAAIPGTIIKGHKMVMLLQVVPLVKEYRSLQHHNNNK